MGLGLGLEVWVRGLECEFEIRGFRKVMLRD